MLFSMVLAQSNPRKLNQASHSVARAFALSLLFHALLFATLEIGYQTGFWKATLLFRKQAPKLDAMTRLLEQAKQQREQEMPLVFVEVDPTHAAPEPPKDAK